MIFHRLLYFFRQTWLSLRNFKSMTLLTSSTIAVCLLIAGLYAVALDNIQNLAHLWGHAARVSVYISDTLPVLEQEKLRTTLAHQDHVVSATLITPQQAIARFRQEHASAAMLVEGVNTDIFPASVELELADSAADLQTIQQLALTLSNLPGVREVDYGREDFEHLTNMLDVLRIGGWIAGIVLILAAAFIVSNTVRLTVYARREEIRILQLVGATRWFVRAPFLLEGMVWGLSGGILSATTLWLLNQFLAPKLSAGVTLWLDGMSIRLFRPELALSMVVCGTVLGVLCSGLAVRRFLDINAENA